MLRERRDAKRAKLLQFAERVWHITKGSEDQRIEGAIAATEAFFNRLGVKTRLADYDLGAEAIGDVVVQLESHGMVKIGERREITPAVSRRILEAAL